MCNCGGSHATPQPPAGGESNSPKGNSEPTPAAPSAGGR
jgi:hypothetical protein